MYGRIRRLKLKNHLNKVLSLFSLQMFKGVDGQQTKLSKLQKSTANHH